MTLVSVLQSPALLLTVALSGGLIYGAVEWGDDTPVPGLGQRLSLEQRASAAALGSAILVQWLGSTAQLARVAFLCAGLTLSHAAFRARSLAARWSFFRDSVEKEE